MQFKKCYLFWTEKWSFRLITFRDPKGYVEEETGNNGSKQEKQGLRQGKETKGKERNGKESKEKVRKRKGKERTGGERAGILIYCILLN